jgi:3-dehydroquinate synthetase
VLADPAVLETLPARERRAAFGELVKYALLDGDELFAEVEALAPWAAAGDGAAAPVGLADVIRRCAAIKSWVVAGDEREQRGERATLNLGHTVGHAIEAAAGYGTVLHGEAVALGLIAACRVSAAVGPCESGMADRVAAVIRRAGLSDALEPWLRDEVLERIAVDKKRAGDRVDFIVVRAPGDVHVVPLRLPEIRSFLRA